jgi:hypothetical protein
VRTSIRPDLLMTDRASPDAGPDTWMVQFLIEKDTEAYLGPFLMDRGHPLTDGLTLQQIVWAAGKGSVPGRPIILAGNIPLLTDSENGAGRHEIRLRLKPELSTLPSTPQWPILIWNLIHWRAARMPGLDRTAVRPGETAVLTVPAGVDMVEVHSPGGISRRLPVHDRQVVVNVAETGLHELRAADSKYDLAVNTLNREESDLSGCVTGRWGEWTEPAGDFLETRGYAWILLLLAGVVLTVHLLLITGRMSSGGVP